MYQTSLASHTLQSPRERGSGNLAYTELYTLQDSEAANQIESFQHDVTHIDLATWCAFYGRHRQDYRQRCIKYWVPDAETRAKKAFVEGRDAFVRLPTTQNGAFPKSICLCFFSFKFVTSAHEARHRCTLDITNSTTTESERLILQTNTERPTKCEFLK